MKKITIFSGLAFVCAAALTAVLVSMSFAQDPSRSEVNELKDKIKNMENKIEKYKNCVSQERSGTIILYKDPSTSDCMAISTASFIDYLKEKGLTTSQITERLANWDQKSSEIKKNLKQSITLVGSELKELKDNLSRIEKRPSSGAKGAAGEMEKMPAGVKFPYTSGRAEADGRDAELHLVIEGT
jgi:DNA-binding transcriptional MerR regulator